MKEIHLVPEHHEDDWHTTKDCWCRPSWFETRVSVFQTQRVVFHAEAVSQEGEHE